MFELLKIKLHTDCCVRLSLVLVWWRLYFVLQGKEKCQPVYNFFRPFHSSFTTCVPKGTRVGSKVAMQITRNLSPRVEALLSRSQLKSVSRMGLGLQIKTERISSPKFEGIRSSQSLSDDSSTRFLRKNVIAQKPPVSVTEGSCSCGYSPPQPIPTCSHYGDTIPLISCDPSQSQGSGNLVYADFKFLTAICCIIYLFRIIYILQIVIIAVISLFCT
jgi:hypothetical protein